MNINYIVKSSFAVVLLSTSAAVLAVPSEFGRITAEGTVLVNGISDLKVTFNSIDNLTVDDIKAGLTTRVLSFTPTATSGLIASAFTNPSGTYGECTNAVGNDINNTIQVCIDPSGTNKTPIQFNGVAFLQGDSGREYHLHAGDGNKNKTINPDVYKVSLQFVNYTN